MKNKIAVVGYSLLFGGILLGVYISEKQSRERQLEREAKLKPFETYVDKYVAIYSIPDIPQTTEARIRPKVAILENEKRLNLGMASYICWGERSICKR